MAWDPAMVARFLVTSSSIVSSRAVISTGIAVSARIAISALSAFPLAACFGGVIVHLAVCIGTSFVVQISHFHHAHDHDNFRVEN
jgi:hypothetical protein